MQAVRKIIHVDMDAFYASVEQRDHPAYRGKPVVVGGRPEQRGAVAAASYEARQYGIHSAMPSRTAIQKCPHLIFATPRFDVYRAVSAQIREIFSQYTDLVEPLALDEAYLDVTENRQGLPSATHIAQAIQTQIRQETGLTASAGVSFNKFLAKVASGMNKPNGLCVIRPEVADEFVALLPIEKFHGVGQVTAAKMHRLGIRTGADLRIWSEAELVQQFGKVGRHYYRIARSQDDRPVEPNRERKSIGVERTFVEDVSDRTQMHQALAPLLQELQERIHAKHMCGRTLTLKVKFADYQQITRSRTLAEPIAQAGHLAQLAQQLLDGVDVEKPVRLLGLAIANLSPIHPTAQLQTQNTTLHPMPDYVQLTLEF
ncbi:DNA polymerase IV [Leptolyngbya sp. AN02str]|uniref:DNA polymerase IV n=1 Tax=Leptolyngbya sp. AN02str TaxID=3423363 RepID=UPI003D320AE0